MNILLAAVAATTIATVNPSEPMSFDRMMAMKTLYPEVCENVVKLTPPGGNYADTLILYSGAETNTEKLFALVVCGNYLKGKMAR